jgi:transcriptional regulator of heat shock response
MRELSGRLQSVLMAGISDYVRDLLPITSGAISKKTEIAKSSATIRNDLKILEELGYLRQLHISGGRVPTKMGYAEFIENSSSSSKITPNSLSEIIVDLANKVLALRIDNADEVEILGVSIISLLTGGTMFLTKTTAGSIHTNVTLDTPLSNAQADIAGNAITGCLRGLTLGEVVYLGRVYINTATNHERPSLPFVNSASPP